MQKLYLVLIVLICSLINISIAEKKVFDGPFGWECCGSTQIFDPSTKYCCNSNLEEYEVDDLAGLCCGSRLLKIDETCCNGSPVFNPSGDLCCGSRVLTPGLGCCGTNSFDPTTLRCCETTSGTFTIRNNLECCGNTGINPDFLCCGGVGVDTAAATGNNACCGNANVGQGRAYNDRTQTCCSVEVADPVTGAITRRFTVATGLNECCGLNAVTYDPSTQLCCPNADSQSASIISRTGTTAFDTCCGASGYNSLTQTCCSSGTVNRVLTLNAANPDLNDCCFSSSSATLFDSNTQICCAGGTVVARNDRLGLDSCCGTTAYDSSYQACCNNRLSCGDTCCGDTAYFAASETCCGGKIYDRDSSKTACCYETPYNPDTETCCMGRIFFKPPTFGSNFQCCLDYLYESTNKACCYDPTQVDENDVLDNLDDDEPLGERYLFCGNACCGNTNGYFTDTQVCCIDKIYETNPGLGLTCCGNVVYESGSGTRYCCCSDSEAVNDPECSF